MKTITKDAKAERIILALLEHGTQERAAIALNISVDAVRGWLKKPEFQELYRNARREAHSFNIGRAKHAAPLAAKTLSQIMVDKNAPAAVRSRASRIILSRANTSRFEDIEANVERLEREAELRKAEVRPHATPHGSDQANSGLPVIELRIGRKANASAAKMSRIVAALLEHSSHVKAAADCGVSPVTIWRWLKKPEFQDLYRKALSEAYSRAMLIVQQAESAAMSYQKRILSDPNAPASLRVQAAELILDYAATGAQEDMQRRVDTQAKILKDSGDRPRFPSSRQEWDRGPDESPDRRAEWSCDGSDLSDGPLAVIPIGDCVWLNEKNDYEKQL